MGKKLKEVMSRDVEVCNPNDTLVQVAEKMRALNVGPIPICDGEKIKGMITDRDIVVRAIALGHDPRSTKASDIMTDQIEWCFEDVDVEEAAKLMSKKQIRRLLVLNRDKKLVGIVSLGDVVVKTHEDELAGHVLEDISEPAAPAQ
jgi:CBS domain-containing protein